MAAEQEDLGQGAPLDGAASAYEARRQLEPMVGAEKQAFDWVIRKLAEEDPEAGFAALCMDGLDQGWFIVDELGLLRVSQEAPE